MLRDEKPKKYVVWLLINTLIINAKSQSIQVFYITKSIKGRHCERSEAILAM